MYTFYLYKLVILLCINVFYYFSTMAKLSPSGPDSLESLRDKCEHARKDMDMAMVCGLQYLSKSKDMWQHQYLYSSQDYEGNVLPLTGEKF